MRGATLRSSSSDASFSDDPSEAFATLFRVLDAERKGVLEGESLDKAFLAVLGFSFECSDRATSLSLVEFTKICGRLSSQNPRLNVLGNITNYLDGLNKRNVPEVTNNDTGKERRGRLLAGQNMSYEWIRKCNDMDARTCRAEAAALTVDVCEKGGYILDGTLFKLGFCKSMLAGTRIVKVPVELHVDNVKKTSRSSRPLVKKHRPGSMIQVGVELASKGLKVAVVNAASAYHAGGGFLEGGRHALEESICTQSTLYHSLLVAKHQSKKQNVVPSGLDCSLDRKWQRYIPEDGVVLSPNVEVFRDGTATGYQFRSEVTRLAAVVSLAMPNCNAKVRDAPVDFPANPDDYFPLISAKFKAALNAATQVDADTLVVCDAGCGVYQNDPATVGHTFGKVLREYFLKNFSEVHIAGSSTFADAVERAIQRRSRRSENRDPNCCA